MEQGAPALDGEAPKEALVVNILALDLATSTGWALTEGSALTWGTVDFTPRRGEDGGMRFLRFNRWLREICGYTPNMDGGDWLPPMGLIVYEEAHHRGGPATEVGVGLVTRVKEIHARLREAKLDVRLTSCHTATLKKFALGRGRGEKSEMIAAARRRLMVELAAVGRTPATVPGIDRLTEHEADALHLLWWAQEQIGVK